jgi:hypothetical protein
MAEGLRGILLGAVAALNIALLSVTEWTTEINVRMAVGTGLGIILAQLLVRALSGAIARRRYGSRRMTRTQPARCPAARALTSPSVSPALASPARRCPSLERGSEKTPWTHDAGHPPIRHPTPGPLAAGVRTEEIAGLYEGASAGPVRAPPSSPREGGPGPDESPPCP